MSVAQLPVTVGEVIADKYRVDRIVGSGGMSVVLLAWHIELEQEVAIKVLHGADLESDAAKRFRREARAAARIRSEHVSRVLDVGTLPNGSPFMVMEYLVGNDLAEELARRGPLPIEEIVIYVLQAIEALSEAHAAGIVHRDLKPENLFLSLRADGTRAIKVLDFGISKAIAPQTISELSLTKTASFVGSPLYMSPEQMRSSRSVDGRTDVWSLGAIMYEAASGRLPYYAESIGELCARLLQDSPPPLGELRSGMPPGFETVVLRCLEKDRERRYANLGELARALVPFAAGANVYAERAERVLAMAGLRATMSSTGVSNVASVNPSYVRDRLSTSALSARMNVVTSNETGPARNSAPGSWAKTYGQEVVRRKGAIAFGLAVGLGLGLAWAVGPSEREPSTAMPVAVERSEPTPEPVRVAAVAAARPAVEPVEGSFRELGATPATHGAATVDASVPRAPVAEVSKGPAATPPRWLAGASRVRPAPLARMPAEARRADPSGSAPAEANSAGATHATINAWDPAAFGGRH